MKASANNRQTQRTLDDLQTQLAAVCAQLAALARDVAKLADLVVPAQAGTQAAEKPGKTPAKK
jgi:hypothetical protein